MNSPDEKHLMFTWNDGQLYPSSILSLNKMAASNESRSIDTIYSVIVSSDNKFKVFGFSTKQIKMYNLFLSEKTVQICATALWQSMDCTEAVTTQWFQTSVAMAMASYHLHGRASVAWLPHLWLLEWDSLETQIHLW